MEKYRFPNYSALAASVKRELDGEDNAWAWRTLTMAIDDAKQASDEELLEILSVPAAPTGNKKADAGVAAMAEYLCGLRLLNPPAWTQESWREVTPWWFIVKEPILKQIAFVESPVSFSKRGIFVTKSGLMRA